MILKKGAQEKINRTGTSYQMSLFGLKISSLKTGSFELAGLPEVSNLLQHNYCISAFGCVCVDF